MSVSSCVRNIFNVWVTAERMPAAVLHQCVGRDCWWPEGPYVWPHRLRQPLPRFPLTWSAKATGRCTTGSHSTNAVHAWWCSVLCEMFSVTPVMPDGQVEEDPLRGLHAPRQIWIFWISTCRDTWTPLCMQLLLTTERHFTIPLWMPVRLSATAPASLHGYCGPWWSVWSHALNLMEGILSIYYMNVLFQLWLTN
jgi:hypothetical protein